MAISLVQSAHNSVSGSGSLTLTFSSDITSGNSVIVCVAGNNAASLVSVSGSSDTYSKIVAGAEIDGAILLCASSVGGYNSFTVTVAQGSGGTYAIIAFAYEVSGSLITDQYSTDGTLSSGDYNSGTTPTTDYADEFWVGMGDVEGSSSTSISAPTSGGYTNFSPVNNVYSGSSSPYYISAVSGYQVVSSAGTTVYQGNGTISGSNYGAEGLVATFYAKDVNVTSSGGLSLGLKMAGAESPQPPTSGLLGWYRADAITGVSSGGAVTTWPDSSGNGYTMTSQQTAALLETDVYNGLPCVRFAGASQYITGNVISESQPVSAYFIVNPTSGNRWGNFTTNVRFGTGTNAQIYAGATLSAGNTVNGVNYVGYIVDGATSTVRVNGTTTTGNAGTNAPGTYLGIGAEGDQYQPYNGDVMEVLFYAGALTTAELEQLDAYAASKYIPAVTSSGGLALNLGLDGSAQVATATGAVSLNLAMAGTAAQEFTSAGAIRLGLALDGTAAEDIASAGAIILGLAQDGSAAEEFTSTGAIGLDLAQDGRQGNSGQLALNLAMDGQALAGNVASGGLSLSGMKPAGSALAGNTSSGGLELALKQDGTAAENIASAGAVRLSMALAGTSGEDIAATGAISLSLALAGSAGFPVGAGQAYQWTGEVWAPYQWGTGSIYANSITAEQIAAETITTDLIAANAITAGLLAAGIVYAGIVDGTTITGATIVGDGTSGEFLAYSGTPAAGNLIASVSGAAGTDAHGNAVKAGVWAYNTAGAYAGLEPAAGQAQLRLGPGGATHSTGDAIIFASAFNTGEASEYQQLNLSAGSSQSDGAGASGMQIISNSADGTVPGTIEFYAGGDYTGSINPGDGTWHSLSLLNSWEASGEGADGVYYRTLPFGLTEVIGDIINATATGNSVFAQLPSGPAFNQNHPAGWNNVAASNSASPPWIAVLQNGELEVAGLEAADKGIFFHLLIPTGSLL